MLRRYVRNYSVLIGLAGLVIAMDQWTKWLVRERLPFEATWLPAGMGWLHPYARIVHWHNSGAAFGMFQGAGIIFTVLAIVVICAIVYYFQSVEPSDWTLRLAMALQLGGAAGNLIDRLLVGRVTDFISIGTFPVFNVADSAISVGVAILLLGMWLKDRRSGRLAGPASTPESTVLER
jgi:signal peptidase II